MWRQQKNVECPRTYVSEWVNVGAMVSCCAELTKFTQFQVFRQQCKHYILCMREEYHFQPFVTHWSFFSHCVECDFFCWIGMRVDRQWEWHTKTLAHRINGWPNATKVITKCHTNSEVKYREKTSSTAKYLHIWFPFWFGFFFIAAAILVSLICVNGIRIHFDGSKNIGKLVPNRVLWRYLFRTQSSIRRIQNQIELLKCSMRLCEILLYFFFNFPWVFE